MKEQSQKPVTYARFYDRLKRGWVLKKAINTPNCKPYMIHSSITSKRNGLRKLTVKFISDNNKNNMNIIRIPKPKPTLWQRIKRWLEKKGVL